ncbi:MAG: DUF4351 domain-containing protein [Magnetococcales bacterium]|nr:DUF4351 domain-containing protein [Magnetococcales bacterium]
METNKETTCWHCLIGEALKNLLEPVGIEVRSEVQVVSAPPKADLILIQRKSQGWTPEQRVRLADGLRDLEADHILIELKITESLNENTLAQLSVYDHLYLDSAKLQRHQLQSVLISAKTPERNFLERFAFAPVGLEGIHESKPLWGGVLRLILLNELADEPHNAPLKCFASRMEERRRAFETIGHAGLFRLSVEFGQTMIGLWRLMMKGSLNHPEMNGITPEYVSQLGKEWFEAMIDMTPEDDLFSLPKLEHRLAQEHQNGLRDGLRDGEKKGKAEMLTRQLHRRFGTLPEWANKKIADADLSSLEAWSLGLLDAPSLDAIFTDQK